MGPTPRSITDNLITPIVYSFCSLVTDRDEYEQMVSAFVNKGFSEKDCEFLFADNTSGNRFDAFVAYNRFLIEAQGRYIILCHQDVLPLNDDRQRLDETLVDLTALDPFWGICGNAGSTEQGEKVLRVTHGENIVLDRGRPLPRRVMSVDENFMVVRREANLAASRDLKGFHWYGADIGIIASLLGWNTYVVDFHIYHKSSGKISSDFISIGKSVRVKYRRAFRSRWHHVPTERAVYLSGNGARTLIARSIRYALRKLRIDPGYRE